jgi:chromate transporter
MSLVQLARAWFVVATQSIGGGPATLLLIRREMVERHAWITLRQFLEDYALSKMGLGINLVTLAGLIGSRIAGMRGVIVSVASLVVPAALITIALTAGYTLVRDSELVRAALNGAGPVAAGMTAGFAFTLAQGSVRRGRRAAIDYAYACAVLVVALLTDASPLIVIPIGIAVGATFLRGESSRATGEASG